MYLLPILVDRRSALLSQAWLFLERNGTHMIEVPSLEAASAFLAENEIPVAGPPFLQKGLPDILFAPVDPNAKGLDAFYSWREVIPGSIPTKEAWRNFLWDSGGTLGINAHLGEILVSPSHTVAQILEGFFATAA
jgi:hypothetical protein